MTPHCEHAQSDKLGHMESQQGSSINELLMDLDKAKFENDALR